MTRSKTKSRTASKPRALTYEEAFDLDLAGMTVAEFIRWNPHFTEDEARIQIAAAKAKVERLKRKGLCPT
jgi:hypothetical protein